MGGQSVQISVLQDRGRRMKDVHKVGNQVHENRKCRKTTRSTEKRQKRDTGNSMERAENLQELQESNLKKKFVR